MNARRRISLRIGAAAAIGSLVLTAFVATSAAAVEPLTTIPVGLGATRTVFAPDGLTAYVTNRDDDTVSVVDVSSYLETTVIPVGDEPFGISITPDGSEVWVVNQNADTVSIISTATDTVLSTIPARNYPYDVEFSADGATAFVVNYGDNALPANSGSVSVVDVASRTETDIIVTDGYPQGIDLSPDGTFLYVTATNNSVAYKIDVQDVTNASIVDTIAIPAPVGEFTAWPDSVVFTPDGLFAYTSNNIGDSVSIIDIALGVVVDEIAVGNGPVHVDISPDGATVYATIQDLPTKGVVEIDVATGTAGAIIPVGDDPHSAVVSPDGNLVYVADEGVGQVLVLGDPVTRTSGTDRYKTAIAVSRAAFPAGAPFVFIATGGNFPDALSAGPAAALVGGPLLLTASTTLPASVKAEIERLNPQRIVVIGGEGVVSAAVFDELTLLAPSIERTFGATRYATSRAIAEKAFGPGGATNVYIATGRNFPDALGASAVGASYGEPVILVDGTAATVDAATLDLLSLLGTVNIRISGGTGVVSSGIEAQLALTYNVVRFGGANRYETSNLINSDGYPFPGDATRVFLATGLNFPDALAGSAWAGRVHAPLFIVPGTCIPSAIMDKIIGLGVYQVTLIGGTGVVTQSVFDLTECA